MSSSRRRSREDAAQPRARGGARTAASVSGARGARDGAPGRVGAVLAYRFGGAGRPRPATARGARPRPRHGAARGGRPAETQRPSPSRHRSPLPADPAAGAARGLVPGHRRASRHIPPATATRRPPRPRSREHRRARPTRNHRPGARPAASRRWSTSGSRSERPTTALHRPAGRRTPALQKRASRPRPRPRRFRAGTPRRPARPAGRRAAPHADADAEGKVVTAVNPAPPQRRHFQRLHEARKAGHGVGFPHFLRTLRPFI